MSLVIDMVILLGDRWFSMRLRWRTRCDGSEAGCVRPGRPALASERLVDLDEHLLLALAQAGVGQNCGDDLGVAVVSLEDAGPHVELLGRDPQTLGDLLQDVRAGLAQPALDLRQIRIGNTGNPSQLAQGDLRLLTLLADEFAD